jgi:hypothetical protein
MYQNQQVSPEKITKQQQKNRMFWEGNGESGECFKELDLWKMTFAEVFMNNLILVYNVN